MFFGVIRSGFDVDIGDQAPRMSGHCFFNTGGGRRFPALSDWEGMQSSKQGDRIVMLLDLDQGSMTVWKNDEKLGVMQTEGLTGPLCWAVSVVGLQSARIESPPAPASPTEEELAAAQAWQAANGLNWQFEDDTDGDEWARTAVDDRKETQWHGKTPWLRRQVELSRAK